MTRPARLRGLTIAATVLVLAPGCAKSLKEPPPILEVPKGGSRGQPGEAEALLAKAERTFEVRTLVRAREAADLFLEAARADPKKIDGLVGTARARVWLADHEPDAKAREAAAVAAVQAAQWCGRIASDDPRCDYWLGAGLGVQARERRTTALDALPKIVEAFQRAATAAPKLEHAGPDRALALVLVRAPGWPAGPGDPDQGLAHARKAFEIEPGYAPNVMALAEAQAATGHKPESREMYARALELARASKDPEANEWIEEIEKALSSTK